MGDKTGISWTDATWNPIRGCTRVSAGCVNCYAEKVANRFSGSGKPYEGLINQYGRWNGTVRFIAEHLADPLRWSKPRRIFVNSMSDLFHEGLTNEEIAAVFGVMAAAPQHTFQILTKRAQRMREWFEWVAKAEPPYGGLPAYPDYVRERSVCCRCAWMVPGYEIDHKGAIGLHPSDDVLEHQRGPWPLPNVWLGVSVEDQEATHRIEPLLQTPTAVRFLSCEPLIGPIDLSYASPNARSLACDLDWVIAGCESGHGARPCEVAWLRSLRDQCDAAGTAFFLKQAVESTGRCGDADNPNGDDPCGERITSYVYGKGHASYLCACCVEGSEDGDSPELGFGEGSKRKSGGVIELPYLDGVQHAAFPESP